MIFQASKNFVPGLKKKKSLARQKRYVSQMWEIFFGARSSRTSILLRDLLGSSASLCCSAETDPGLGPWPHPLMGMVIVSNLDQQGCYRIVFQEQLGVDGACVAGWIGFLSRPKSRRGEKVPTCQQRRSRYRERRGGGCILLL